MYSGIGYGHGVPRVVQYGYTGTGVQGPVNRVRDTHQKETRFKPSRKRPRAVLGVTTGSSRGQSGRPSRPAVTSFMPDVLKHCYLRNDGFNRFLEDSHKMS